MSTRVTCAPACSPGTRTSSVAKAPAGTASGWMLMCASAAAAGASANSTSASAAVSLRVIVSFLLVVSADGHADPHVELLEFGDAQGERQAPLAGGREHGAGGDPVAGPRGLQLDLLGPDRAARQARFEP